MSIFFVRSGKSYHFHMGNFTIGTINLPAAEFFPAGGPACAGCKASFYKPIPAFVTNFPAYITIL